ncbi:MAG: SAM-dependent methyltransferase [candidate division SR1 bacterium]|nr:SAM-dependent methyltransferase [candidate division SR1 bacterium]
MAQTLSFLHLLDTLQNFMRDRQLIKITLSKKRHKNSGLQNIFIKPILIKGIESFSTVLRFQTKDITKNLTADDILSLIKNTLSEKMILRHCDIFTTSNHIQAIMNKDGNAVTAITHQNKSINQITVSLGHNITKNRLIDPSNVTSRVYLKELGLIDNVEQIIPSMQHKYKQINKYLEILKPYIDKLRPKSQEALIYDMGSGKGYLSFVLADYCLQNNLKKIDVKGVEIRQNLVDQSNNIALLSKISNLTFETGSISDYFKKQIFLDGIVALHACDTATDEAIYMGIKNDASLIVVAPCCHRQIRKNILENMDKTNHSFLKHINKHGILLEREAEYITDTIRALLLEIQGYKVKVMEFINLENTPKNILIIATKLRLNKVSKKDTEKLMADLISIKNHFGISEHYLEELLKIKQ